jgi:hypothetical protein
MTDFIMKRSQDRREQAFNDAFSQPAQFDREYLQNYYNTMISETKKSLRFLQGGLTQLIHLRDKYQYDLETHELIWKNIELTQEAIRQESQTLSELREEMQSAKPNRD